MAFLPEDVRSQQRVLGIVLLLGAGSLSFLYLQVPRQQEAAELRQRLEDLEHRNRGAGVVSGDLDRARAELSRVERRLEAVLALVPRDADRSDLYEELAANSEALGLELMSVAPSREEAEDGAHVRRLRWDVSLEGHYHGLGRFLARMASLPRIVRPSVRRIEGLGHRAEGRYPVRAEVVLETFVQRAGAALPPADREARDTTRDSLLPYERELFVYPDGDRPNPFRPPAATGGIGPRFEDLRLSGILFGPEAGSVAVLRDAGTGRIHRLREGDRIGNARLMEVRPAAALFVVTANAGSRRELLRVDPGEVAGGRR